MIGDTTREFIERSVLPHREELEFHKKVELGKPLLKEAGEAGLLLVVGSSLEVYPVASLPEETMATGGVLAIVNRGGTQFDARAAVVVDAGAGETLSARAAALP